MDYLQVVQDFVRIPGWSIFDRRQQSGNAPSNQATVEQRLERLTDLLSKGLIAEEEA